MKNKTTLEMKLRGSAEEREDRWAVWSQDFGFTVYGKTEEEAFKALDEAVDTFVNSFGGDDNLLGAYLSKKNVDHRFSGGRFFERDLEVTIGATG